MPATVSDAQPQWAELAAALVEERAPVEGGGVAAVVCPAAHRPPRPLRHVACCAVFRTALDSIWMLRTVGHEWTAERLSAAIKVLSRSPGHLPIRQDPTLAVRLARAVEVPKVEVLAATLADADPELWQTRKLALALRLQQLQPDERAPDPAALAAEVAAIEAELITRLGAALRRFVGSLDGDILAAAPEAARVPALYGYLADPAHRRNRLQLAATFPLFLRAAADADAGNAGDLIARLVDDGAPLVRALAAYWAVSPGVLRCLRGQPVAVIGAQWQANIRALVTVLNALPAEFRPGDVASWRNFNDGVAFAESTFRCRPWTSPLALAWLRQASKRNWSAAAPGAAGEDLHQSAIALVDEVRQALIDALLAEGTATSATVAEEAMLSARAWFRADSYLAGLAPKRMIALAQRYRRELAQAQREHASEIAAARGSGFWPLLPGEYVSSDRARIVVPLASRRELLVHGRAVDNCLGDSHLSHFSALCGRGETFIVGVLEAGSRRPLSTAEVRAWRLTLGSRTEVRLVQHTTARNAPPSRACRDAVAEAIALLDTPRGQDHLRCGARTLAARRQGDPKLRREFDLLPVRQAVKSAVGDKRYEELAAMVRQGAA